MYSGGDQLSVFVVQVLRVRDMMSLKFSEKVYEGFWFSPEMEFLQNAMDFSQRWAVVPRTEHFVDDTRTLARFAGRFGLPLRPIRRVL